MPVRRMSRRFARITGRRATGAVGSMEGKRRR
jgi:hypothetical protein